MTLYEQNPAAWDTLAADGRENLRIVAKMFDRCVDMDRALGFAGATKHWHAGKNRATSTSDKRAAQWLSAQGKASIAKHVAHVAPQEHAAQGTMMLVAVPAGMDAKVAKVLGILGCDVTEV